MMTFYSCTRYYSTESFVGVSLTVTDDAANDRTIVEVTQGERIVIGEDQFKVETADGLPFIPPRTETGGTGDLSLLSSSIGCNCPIIPNSLMWLK